MMNIKETVEQNKELIQSTYDDLHEIPEIGMQEYKTSAYLKNKMKETGVFDEIIEVGETGIVGVIKGQEPGPVVGVRADIDALEFEIDGEKVRKHACAHDAHATMALSAAIIAGKAGIKKGTLKLVLQPAEEILIGALSMIESGQVADIDELYGMHLRPIQEAKLGEATAGLWHSASRVIEVKITGKEGHGARPHLGINAIDAGVAIVNAVNAIHLNPAINFSAKCTKFQAGGLATNIIPSNCDLTFDIRAEYNDDMDELVRKMELAIEHGAQTAGATATITRNAGVPAAEYNEELLGVVREAIENTLGSAIPDIHTPGGEDFHFFATEAGLKTAYFGVGADLTPGLHSIDMEFNRDVMLNGVEILLNIINMRLM